MRLGFSDLWVAGQKLHSLSLNELGRAYAGTPSSNYLTEQKTRAVINSPILCELMCVCVLVFLCSSLIPAPVRPVLRLSFCAAAYLLMSTLSAITAPRSQNPATFAHCARMACSTWSCQDAYVAI